MCQGVVARVLVSLDSEINFSDSRHIMSMHITMDMRMCEKIRLFSY